jgi:hypothetical protein
LVLRAWRWLPERTLVLVTDSSFAALEFLAALGRHKVTCITRLRLDAALYAPAPQRPPGTKGRSRKTGARLASLPEALSDTKTMWQHITIPSWYGEGERRIDLTSGIAVWRHSGLSVVPIRWVLVRDPLGRFTPQALLCTTLEHPPEQVLCWFVQRWQLEVTFEETRAHLGVETQRQMVRPCHRAHHALPARVVLSRHPACGTARRGRATQHRSQRLAACRS